MNKHLSIGTMVFAAIALLVIMTANVVGSMRNCERDCLSHDTLPDNPICRACEGAEQHPEWSIVISN